MVCCYFLVDNIRNIDFDCEVFFVGKEIIYDIGDIW